MASIIFQKKILTFLFALFLSGSLFAQEQFSGLQKNLTSGKQKNLIYKINKSEENKNYTSVYSLIDNANTNFKTITVTNQSDLNQIQVNVFYNLENSTEKLLTLNYSRYGGLIISENSDSLKIIDRDLNYELLLYFEDTSKRFIKVSEIISNNIFYKLDPIAESFIFFNKSLIDKNIDLRLLDEKNKKIAYEAERKRQMEIEDSIKAIKIKNEQEFELLLKKQFQDFSIKRDTTYYTLSNREENVIVDQINSYLKSKLLNEYCKNFTIQTNFKIRIDTLGKLESIKNQIAIDKISDQQNKILDETVSNIKTLKFIPEKQSFNGEIYSMKTEVIYPFKISSTFRKEKWELTDKNALRKLHGQNIYSNNLKSEFLNQKHVNGKYQVKLCKTEFNGFSEESIEKIHLIKSYYGFLGLSVPYYFTPNVTNEIPKFSNGDILPLTLSGIYRWLGIFYTNGLYLGDTANIGFSSVYSQEQINSVENQIDSLGINYSYLKKIDTKYFNEPKYSEYGLFIEPINKIFIKGGITIFNAKVVSVFEDENPIPIYSSYIMPSNLNYYLITKNIKKIKFTGGIAWYHKYFQIEAGYNFFLNSPYASVGVNLPIN